MSPLQPFKPNKVSLLIICKKSKAIKLTLTQSRFFGIYSKVHFQPLFRWIQSRYKRYPISDLCGKFSTKKKDLNGHANGLFFMMTALRLSV